MTQRTAIADTNTTLVVDRHYPALDGLRGIAILLVIYHHSAAILTFENPSLVQNHVYFNLPLVGWCGVDLFFVLSGFLITCILVDTAEIQGRLKKFYIRRALRIFPIYYLTLLVGLTAAALTHGSLEFGYRELAYLFYAQNWLEVAGLQELVYLSHFWSLAVEEQFYILWPWLFLLAGKRSLAIPLCLSLIVGAISVRLFLVAQEEYYLAYILTIARGDALLAGALVALLLQKYRNRDNIRLIGVLTMSLSLLYLLLLASVNGGLHGYDARVLTFGLPLFTLLFAGLVAWSINAPAQHPAITLLCSRPLRAIGQVSYGMYLFHWPLMYLMYALARQGVIEEGDYRASHCLLLFGGLLSSYLLARLSYVYIERYFLSLKNKYAKYDT